MPETRPPSPWFPGTTYKRMGLNSTASTDIFLDECTVPSENLIGEAGNGLKMLVSLVVELGLPGMSAVALGLAQASLDAAIQHASHRTIGGQPLKALPTVQAIIAEMAVYLEAIKGIIENSLQKGTPLAAFQAKLFAIDETIKITDMALQIHGGQGYTKELPIERYCRDARGLKLHLMTPEILKNNIAKILLDIK